MKKILLLGLILTTSLMLVVFTKNVKNYKKVNKIENKKIEKKEIIGDFDKILNEIDQNNIEKNLRYLSSNELEGRMSGKKGNVLAFDFLKKEFEKFGLQTAYQKFPIERMNAGPKNEFGNNFTQNLFAWIDGNDSILKNEIIVIGAHGDHVGYGPKLSLSKEKNKIHHGADDNASGTVAVLELAKIYSKLKNECKRTVLFQIYSAEEMGLIGSRYYCENPLFPKESPNIKNHIFMLNLDMIGYLDQGQHFALFNQLKSSLDIDDAINELNQRYDFAQRITGRVSGASDHASFYNKFVPVVFLHTGLHENYHTPSDTYEKINYKGIAQITKYAFELSWKFVNVENKPRFNYAKFEELDYNYDHDNPNSPFKSNKENKK